MSITLWDWLEDLNWLVGADFPEADEDALWRCSHAWSGAAADLRDLAPTATVAGERVLIGLGGDAGAAFADRWDRYAGGGGLIHQMASACDQLAAACDNAAIEVEYAKLEYIAALVALAAAIAALTASLVAGGVSALGMPVAVATAQFAIRLILTRLLTAVVLGTAFNVAMDVVAQLVQVFAGHRHEWDLAKTARAAEDGAIYGAVGGGIFLAAGRFLPGLLATPVRLAIPLAATGAIGGLAAPLAHGELPTGRDFLMAVTSGVAGGLGPDLVHGRASTPDLSRLDTLDGGGAASTALAGRAMEAGFESPGTGWWEDEPLPDQPAATDAGPGVGGDGARAVVTGAPWRSVEDGRSVGERRPDGAAFGRASGAEEPSAGSGHDRDGASVLAGGLASDVARPAAHPGLPVEVRPTTDGTAGPAGLMLPVADRGPVRAEALATGPAPADAGPVPGPPSVVGPAAPVRSAPTGSGATVAIPSQLSGPTGGTGHSAPGPATETAPGGVGPVVTLLHSVAERPAVHLAGVDESSPVADGGSTVVRGNGPAGPGPTPDISTVDTAGWASRGGADLPGWTSEDGRASLSGIANRAADLVLERAAAVEPRITSIARDIAHRAGGELLGESDRLKKLDRFKIKLSGRLVRDPMDTALARMKDSLRYTIGLAESDYAGGTKDAIGGLIEHGFRPVGDRQIWDAPSGYLGYNTFWSDPVTGHVFEVQFHTEASFVAKSVSHNQFREIREATPEEMATPEYLAKKAAHDAYFDDVVVPAGALEVGLPAGIPRHDPTSDLPPVHYRRPADPAVASSDDPAAAPRWLATDAEVLQLAQEIIFPTRAGLAFYPVGDEVRAFAGAVRPTDGYVTVDLHGSARGFRLGEQLLTPVQFAEAMHQLRAAGVLHLPPGVGIKLLSCDTARGDQASPAAVLARRLLVEVVAPDQPVWTSLDGDEVVSSPTLRNGNLVPTDPPDGNWFRFIPVPG